MAPSVEQTQLRGEHSRVGSIAGVQTWQKIRDVVFHRTGLQAQLFADLTIRQTAREQTQDVSITRVELIERRRALRSRAFGCC